MAVEAVDLARTFKTSTGVFRRQTKQIEAVKGVSFEIGQGELFGLLGPNGAGKTTTIKMLITLLLPTAGTARVCGLDVTEHTREVRRLIGYVFGGDRGLYDRLSARDNLRYFAELYAVPAREQKARIDELLELVKLTDRQGERVEGFSRGMRQRLHIARGLLHDPQVVFLDEPSIGIDPVGARELRETVANLTTVGKTVLLTTHYMFEADELCDRIAVIAGGEIVATGTPSYLKDQTSAGKVIETYGVADQILDQVRSLAGIRTVTVTERGQVQALQVATAADVDLTAHLLGLLTDTRVGRVSSREPTLEDAYIELVTR